MGFFSNIRKRSAAEALPMEDLSAAPFTPVSGTSGFLAVATVYRCVRLLSDSVARLPIAVEKEAAPGLYLPESGTLGYLLSKSPNADFSAFDFWRQTVQQYLCWGNAILVPGRYAAGEVSELVLASPNAASFDISSRKYTINDENNRIYGEYSPKEVIHFRNMSGSGFWGVSVLESARQAVEAAASGDRETIERFRKGGNVRGFLTNPPASVTGYNPYSDKAVKQAAEVKEKFFKLGGGITYLPGGLQFKELMMSSADMQFLESRKFTVTEICRFFGIDPKFISDDGSGNYKAAEMASMKFLCYSLAPILEQFQQELERKLLPGDTKRRIRFDQSAILCSDLETKQRLQSQRLANGLSTINEERAQIGLKPVANGGEILVSANFKSLEALLAEGDRTDTKDTPQTDDND